MTFPDSIFTRQLLVWWGRLDEERQEQAKQYFKESKQALREDFAYQLERTLPRAARAELKRADSILEISLSAYYQHIYKQLSSWDSAEAQAEGLDQEQGNKRESELKKILAQAQMQDRLALLVGLLVHVKKLDLSGKPKKFAEVASMTGEDKKPAVSPLRFERLLRSPELVDLYTGLRRMLPLLKDGFDLESFCYDILHWNDITRKQWAYAYDWPEKMTSE